MSRTPSPNFIPNLASRLRRARVRLRLTQAAAAERVGASTITFLRWENGQASPKSSVVRRRVLDLLLAAERGDDGVGQVSDDVAVYGTTAPTLLPQDAAVALADRIAAVVRQAVLEELARARARA